MNGKKGGERERVREKVSRKSKRERKGQEEVTKKFKMVVLLLTCLYSVL